MSGADEKSNLEFQDFGEVHLSTPDILDSQQTFAYQIDEVNDDDDGAESKLISPDDDTAAVATSSFWTFEFYQQFFNVDSKQVLGRMLGSMFPRRNVNFLQTNIRPNPDLYGPVWISITLIFLIAILGNIVNYFHYFGEEAHGWHYDFNKVTISATVILVYVFLIPCLIYTLLLWRGNAANYTLLETVCVYGYSLTIFLPVALLWMIPFAWLQWGLVCVATVLSGGVLVMTFYPAVSHMDKKVAILTVTIMVLAHGALATGFMLYFFHVPPTHPTTESSVPVSTTTSMPTSISYATTPVPV